MSGGQWEQQYAEEPDEDHAAAPSRGAMRMSQKQICA
jgi:hypothetical protein